MIDEIIQECDIRFNSRSKEKERREYFVLFLFWLVLFGGHACRCGGLAAVVVTVVVGPSHVVAINVGASHVRVGTGDDVGITVVAGGVATSGVGSKSGGAGGVSGGGGG